MAQNEKCYQEEGCLKPTLLRLGRTNSIISESNGDDENGPVMFTDSCSKCGSKKRRCLTPSFEPRKKTILIDPTSLKDDEFVVQDSIPRTRTGSIPLSPSVSLFSPPHQMFPPPPPSFVIGSVPNPNPTPPPSTRSNPILISSSSSSSPEQKFTATPPPLQPNPFVRSNSTPITYPTPPFPISPNKLCRNLSDINPSFVPSTATKMTSNGHDQMTILQTNSVPATTPVRLSSIAYVHPSLSDPKASPQTTTLNGDEPILPTSDKTRDSPKVMRRLSSIKESLSEMNKLLSDIIQEQINIQEEEEEEEEAEAEKDEKTDNSCKEIIHEYETLPEENVISSERDGDAMRVRYLCCCGKRYQIFLGAE